MTPTTPQQPESKTPRVDGFYWKSTGIAPVGRGSSEWADFARQLETELNEANERAAKAGIHPFEGDYYLGVLTITGNLRYLLNIALKERDEAFTNGMKKAAEICLSHNNSGEGADCRKAILSAIAEIENPTT